MNSTTIHLTKTFIPKSKTFHFGALFENYFPVCVCAVQFVPMNKMDSMRQTDLILKATVFTWLYVCYTISMENETKDLQLLTAFVYASDKITNWIVNQQTSKQTNEQSSMYKCRVCVCVLFAMLHAKMCKRLVSFQQKRYIEILFNKQTKRTKKFLRMLLTSFITTIRFQ